VDIKRNGLEVRVVAAEQPDEWLLGAAQEIAEAAEARGLELPQTAGAVALEGAAQSDEPEVEAVPFTPETAESLASVKTRIRDRLLRAEGRGEVVGIVDQFEFAFTGYQSVAEMLNFGRHKKERVNVANQETVAAEFAEWFTVDKIVYIAEAMETDPELRFTLVATPNVTVTADEVIKQTDEFGKRLPYNTDAWSHIIKRYTPEQLSGTHPENGNAIQFSLIPSKLNPELYGTIAQQRDTLAKLQADMPDLRVPSVLEELALWQTLRANGDLPATGVVFERTYIRHFDLPEERIGGFSGVPGSCGDGSGGPDWDDSYVRDAHYGRVLVG
jgi:hypothetical protein